MAFLLDHFFLLKILKITIYSKSMKTADYLKQKLSTNEKSDSKFVFSGSNYVFFMDFYGNRFQRHTMKNWSKIYVTLQNSHSKFPLLFQYKCKHLCLTFELVIHFFSLIFDIILSSKTGGWG